MLKNVLTTSVSLLMLPVTLALLSPAVYANTSETATPQSLSGRQYQFVCSIFVNPEWSDEWANIGRPALSPDGTVFGVIAHSTLHIWNTQTCELQQAITVVPIQKMERVIHTITFNSDGSLVATGSYDAPSQTFRIAVWDVSTGALVHQMENQQAHLEISADLVALGDFSEAFLLFSADDQQIASILSDEGPVDLWAVTSQQHLQTLEGGPGRMVFSPDGQQLARRGGDYVRIWNLDTPDSPQFLLATDEGIESVPPPAILENYEDLFYEKQLSFSGRVAEVVFSPDNQGLYVAYYNSDDFDQVEIRRWDFATATSSDVLFRFDASRGIPVFSTDGTVIFGVDQEENVMIVELPSGQLLSPTPTQSFPASSLIAVDDAMRMLVFAAESELELRIWRSP